MTALRVHNTVAPLAGRMVIAGEELFWTKLSAMGQVAGSVATFLAVWVSLRIASQSRRPFLRLVVGKRLIIGDFDGDMRLLMFDVANRGAGACFIPNDRLGTWLA